MNGSADEPGWSWVLRRMSCVRGRRVAVEELGGGLSNRTLRVTAVDGARLDVVVRVPAAGRPAGGPAGEAVGAVVDSHAEHRSAVLAAAAGVAPAVVEFCPPDGPLVVEHLDARSLTPEEVRADLRRVAALCRKLHAGQRFDTDFEIDEVLGRYLAGVARLGTWRPRGHADLESTVARVLAALAASAPATVPCHNDLPGRNVLDDGRRLWLVDFEFAGNNDPCFELGNLASGAALGVDQVEELLTAYDGSTRVDRVARTRLWSAVCSWAWVLWASLQDATSGLGHDYRALGAQLHEQAREGLDGSTVDRLLAQATDPPDQRRRP